MQAIAQSGVGEVSAICDPSPQCRDEALEDAPGAKIAASLDEMLALDLDGIVIATPSAMHAAQSIAALDAGMAVFCQKPLGRTAAETSRVVDAARAADRLLGVDFSYRKIRPFETVRRRIAEGAIGEVFAADLVFHNAYGPGKPWFHDLSQSGGGCVIDLGVHLVDMALSALDHPDVTGVTARLMRSGRALGAGEVEDFALATLDLSSGCVARLACSWNLHAGCEAQIGATFHGTGGSLAFTNVDGSFFDFEARLLTRTRSEVIASDDRNWGGRQAVAWARRLSRGEGFNPVEGERLVAVAQVLDRIYER
jgi:predicted dehydrogenase